MLVRLCSKSFKAGFSGTSTKDFQMYNLGIERQRTQRSNCHHLLDRGVSKRIPEKHLLLLHRLYSKAFDCVDCNKLWKIFKEMGKPDHLTCLLRNQYAGQEAAVRTGHRDWLKIGKRVWQGYKLSPCIQSTSCKMLGWMNHKLESRLPQQPQICR